MVDERAEVSPIAGRIRRLMTERGLSARRLAMQCNLGADAIKNILRGRSLEPRLGTLEAIAGGLGVEIGVLVGEIKMPSQSPLDATATAAIYSVQTNMRRKGPVARQDAGKITSNGPNVLIPSMEMMSFLVEIPFADLTRSPAPDLAACLTHQVIRIPNFLAGPAPARAIVAYSPAPADESHPPLRTLIVLTAAAPGDNFGQPQFFLIHDGKKFSLGSTGVEPDPDQLIANVWGKLMLL